MTVEIVDKNGWKYAKIRRPRGQGRAFFQSLGTKSEKDAREKVRASNLEQIQLAAQADALTREVWTRLLAGRNVRVRDAVGAHKEHRVAIGRPPKSIAKEQNLLDQFMRFSGDNFANETIAIVEAKHISAFVNQPGPVKLPTRCWWLSLLSTWLNYCREQGWILKNPTIDVIVRVDGLTQEQLMSKPHLTYSEEEVTKLLTSVPRSDYWHGAILFAYNFGLRLGAVATLEEGNVVTNRLRVFTTKGRKVVDEYMPDDLLAWLEEWKKVRPPSDMTYLFPVQAAAYVDDPSILSRQFKKILVKNGLPDRVFHGLKKAATAKRWESELESLGPIEKRSLMKLVAENGFRKVQRMLAHQEGSSVTEASYMPRR
jgi:integrase